MNPALLLLASALSALLPQEDDRVHRIVALALADAPTLTAEVQEYPDAARKAFAELLSRSLLQEDALAAADVLAEAYFEGWTDPFYLQEAGRFRSWSGTQRRTKLEADSLRLAGNDAFSELGAEAADDRWRRSLDLSRSVPEYHEAGGTSWESGRTIFQG